MKQWLNQRGAVENFGANFRENDNSLPGFMDKGKGSRNLHLDDRSTHCW